MLDLTDFAVQERPEGNLMVAISRPWYNCSYTMAAKPIISLELYYTMMQFLIMNNSKRNKNMGPVVKRDVGKVITLINAFLLKHKIDSWFDV